MLQKPFRLGGRVFEAKVWYDPKKGYPIRVDYGPPRGAGIADADVSYRIRLTEFAAPPPGRPPVVEVYTRMTAARIAKRDVTYDDLFSTARGTANMRRVWPMRADEIAAHGTSPFWQKVGWEPVPGKHGYILGTFRHPDGQLLYLLQLWHRDAPLFYPSAIGGLDLID
jgi:hypothetical protein